MACWAYHMKRFAEACAADRADLLLRVACRRKTTVSSCERMGSSRPLNLPTQGAAIAQTEHLGSTERHVLDTPCSIWVQAAQCCHVQHYACNCNKLGSAYVPRSLP